MATVKNLIQTKLVPKPVDIVDNEDVQELLFMSSCRKSLKNVSI